MVRKRFVKLALAALLVPAATADDWSQFRGAARDGVVHGDLDLAESWPESGPRVVWEREIGDGFAGISFGGGSMFTAYADREAGKEVAGSFDPATGEARWATPIDELFTNEFGDGPRSTPTVHEDSVYVLSSGGKLHALAVEDGAVRWSVDFVESYGASVPRFGYSGSPMIADGLLLIEIGAGAEEGHRLYALDPADGSAKWGVRKGGAGYSSPVRIVVDGEPQYVMIAPNEIYGVSTAGAVQWSHEWPRGTIAMPVVVGDNRIFVSASSDVGGVLLSIAKNDAPPPAPPVDGGTPAEGEEAAEKVEPPLPYVATELWRNREMKNHFSSSIVVGDVIYGFDGATLKAISATDGSRLWAKRGLGKGSLIAADGKIFALGDRGKLVMAAAGAPKYTELGAVEIFDDKSWTLPSLHDGKLYLRNLTRMVCLDLKG